MTHCLLFAAPLLGCQVLAEPITTGTLVREAVDLAALSRFPDPAYRTVQFSSYDRHSTAPYAPGWYANNDGFGGESIPAVMETIEGPNADGVGRYVIARVSGPGAIVRTWTAAMNGELAVYLDDAQKPIYSGSAERFMRQTFAHFAQQAGTLDGDEEAGFRQNDACYFPIAFARSLRIEWTGKIEEPHFYHIEARKYPEGTDIRTFRADDTAACASEIAEARALLADTYGNWSAPADASSRAATVEVPAGRRVEALKVEGPGAVREFVAKLERGDPMRSLRGVILKISFDGADQPQVEAPLGDFFGSGPGIAPFDSLPMTVLPDGTMICRFAMPFRESAAFSLDNRNEEDVSVRLTARVARDEWAPGRSLHFFAKWRVDHGLETHGATGIYDLPYLTAHGRGVMVGVAAMILNPSSVPTSAGDWWGEGDEKVWVDDDAFPSLFGTGSEDYYNYSWSRPDLFHYAYCAQPLDTGPDNRGFVSNIRWHIIDALPFERSIDFQMELSHHGHNQGLSYGRIAYFYGTPELRDSWVPLTTAAVTQGLELPADWLPVGAGASGGAIFFQAEDSLVGADPNATVVEGPLWSAGKLVSWTPSAEGEELSFEVEAPSAGRYEIVVTAAETPASGRFAVLVDGQATGGIADLFTPHLTMLRNHYFGAVDLTAGEHTVTLVSRGKSDSSAGTEIGIDFLWLLPRG